MTDDPWKNTMAAALSAKGVETRQFERHLRQMYRYLHTRMLKNVLTIEVREHLINNYQNHIKIFTDGSVLDSLDSGAGFVIPELKVQKYFYLGKGFSIFTSEL